MKKTNLLFLSFFFFFASSKIFERVANTKHETRNTKHEITRIAAANNIFKD